MRDSLDDLIRGIELAARVAGMSRRSLQRRIADGTLKPDKHAGNTSPLYFTRRKLQLLRMQREVVALMQAIDANGKR